MSNQSILPGEDQSLICKNCIVANSKIISVNIVNVLTCFNFSTERNNISIVTLN